MDSYEAKSKDLTTESSEKHTVGETKEITCPPHFRRILETFEETNDIVEAEKIPSATDVLPPTVSPCKIYHDYESEAKNVNTSDEEVKADTANAEDAKKVDNTNAISAIPTNVKDDRIDSYNEVKEVSLKDSAEKDVGRPTTWATWKPISKSKDSSSGNTEEVKKVDNTQPISEISSNVKDDRVDKDKKISSKDTAEKKVGKSRTWATWKAISVAKDSCSGSTEEAKKEDNTQPISEIPSNAKDRVDSNDDKDISSKDTAEKKVGKPTTWATRKSFSVSKDSLSDITEEAKKVHNTQPISEIPSIVKDDRVASNNKDISSKDSAVEIVGKPKTWATWKSISQSKDSFSGNTEEVKKVHNTQPISEIPSNVKGDRVYKDKEISSKDSAEKNVGKSSTWATWKPIYVSKYYCSCNSEEAKKVDNKQTLYEIPSNAKDDRFDSKNKDKEISSTKSAEENVGEPKTWATWKDISVSKYSFSANSDKAKKESNTQPFSDISSHVKEDRVDSNNYYYKEISSKDRAEINVAKRTTWATRKPISKSKDSCPGNTEVKTSDDTLRISPVASTMKPVTETRESISKIMQVSENVLHQPLSEIEDEETTEELVSDETRLELLIDLGIEGIKDDVESGIATKDLPNPPKKKLLLQDLEQSAINTPVKIDEKKHVVPIAKLVIESVQAIKITDASEFEKEKKSSEIVEDTEEKTPSEIVSEKDNSEASDDTI